MKNNLFSYQIIFQMDLNNDVINELVKANSGMIILDFKSYVNDMFGAYQRGYTEKFIYCHTQHNNGIISNIFHSVYQDIFGDNSPPIDAENTFEYIKNIISIINKLKNKNTFEKEFLPIGQHMLILVDEDENKIEFLCDKYITSIFLISKHTYLVIKILEHILDYVNKKNYNKYEICLDMNGEMIK